MNYGLSASMHQMNGMKGFHLELYGDFVAAREGYKEHQGIDALRYYLMGKYCWLVRDVKSMSIDDIEFAICEERRGWTVPIEASKVYPLPELEFK